MSARTTRAREIAVRPLAGAAPIAIGVVALLLRLRILSLPQQDARVALVAIYLSILIASTLVPAPADRGSVGHFETLIVGLAAVVLASALSGRPPAVPVDSWLLPLSVLAAVAEEALFRRAAYGWLSRWGPAVAIAVTATLFAAIHLPLYGPGAIPVDLGAGILFGWQRWAGGTWTVPAATHAAANMLAVIMR